MGQLHELELAETFKPPLFNRRVPGPVRQLTAVANHRGHLVFQWRPPAGGRAAFYRVERTREGRDYEAVLETDTGWCYIKDAPWHEPWFYRVSAVNARGAGRAKQVWFFQRAGNGKSA
jgi:hypothetical protein